MFDPEVISQALHKPTRFRSILYRYSVLPDRMLFTRCFSYFRWLARSDEIFLGCHQFFFCFVGANLFSSATDLMIFNAHTNVSSFFFACCRCSSIFVGVFSMLFRIYFMAYIKILGHRANWPFFGLYHCDSSQMQMKPKRPKVLRLRCIYQLWIQLSRIFVLSFARHHK